MEGSWRKLTVCEPVTFVIERVFHWPYSQSMIKTIPDWTLPMIRKYENLNAAVQQVAPNQKRWLGSFLQVGPEVVHWAEVTRKGQHTWLRANQEATLHFSEKVGPTVFIREQDGSLTREVTYNAQTRQITEFIESRVA